MSETRNGVAIVGAPQSGKSTFLAVNYYLFQVSAPAGILAEADPNHPDSAKLLYQWEDALNRGHFPDKSDANPPTEIHVNFWNKSKQLRVRTLDPAGEVWDIYNPALSGSAPLMDEVEDYLKTSICYILAVDSSQAPEQDSFYQNLLVNIRAYAQSDGKPAIPTILLFTKIDRITEDASSFEPVIFAKKRMPKTFMNFQYFFQSNQRSKSILACTIGPVAEEGERPTIERFRPSGFEQALLSAFREARIF